MSKLKSILGMALMMAGGMPEMNQGLRSISQSRPLSYDDIHENTPHIRIQRWFLGLSAENQKRIVDLPFERNPTDTANEFLTRRNVVRAVQYFINKYPNHPDLKYKANDNI